MEKISQRYHHLTGFFLRLGLGFIYIYSGYGKLFLGNDTIGVCSNRGEAAALVGNYTWIPIDPEVFVIIQSIVELILGLMLIIGIKTRWAATVSTLLLIAFLLLIDFNLVWKNIALLGASIALALTRDNAWSWDERKGSHNNEEITI
jgi:uncharacterized membrane protein YphA (DoxX/SURF4 family)